MKKAEAPNNTYFDINFRISTPVKIKTNDILNEIINQNEINNAFNTITESNDIYQKLNKRQNNKIKSNKIITQLSKSSSYTNINNQKNSQLIDEKNMSSNKSKEKNNEIIYIKPNQRVKSVDWTNINKKDSYINNYDINFKKRKQKLMEISKNINNNFTPKREIDQLIYLKKEMLINHIYNKYTSNNRVNDINNNQNNMINNQNNYNNINHIKELSSSNKKHSHSNERLNNSNFLNYINNNFNYNKKTYKTKSISNLGAKLKINNIGLQQIRNNLFHNNFPVSNKSFS